VGGLNGLEYARIFAENFKEEALHCASDAGSAWLRWIWRELTRMYTFAMCSYQLHRGTAHARTGELHGLASWQVLSDLRSPAGGRFGYIAENSLDVPNPSQCVLSAVLRMQDQLG
jgi:hypothetical protein